ncbi:MAG: winged helix-turn-helix domain-containing protein [Zoogloeaceae bacterium]|nr:winged helix-turn-helix domain-containing protein [Rhodocyclaceae bacterium]MCP5221651.1 winged helix-turn-helix domain-containing protein [Zoogloeaceae bacterium]
MRRILSEPQRDASLSVQALSARVGLSPMPCWRRLKEFEKAELIWRTRCCSTARRRLAGMPVGTCHTGAPCGDGGG